MRQFGRRSADERKQIFSEETQVFSIVVKAHPQSAPCLSSRYRW